MKCQYLHGETPYRAFFSLKIVILGVAVLALGIANLQGISQILSVEAQTVGNYNLKEKEFQWYSHDPHEAMQKPSLGFDYLLRAGSSSRDYGYVSVQGRLVYDEMEDSKLQLQLYNAFVNFKQREFDLWAGHHKTPLGLSSYLDNHALIMPDNTMSALNHDRDWGIGTSFNRQNPAVDVALTTGSGMPLYLKDSYLLSGRLGWGNYASDNFSVGVSAAEGKVLRSMGYNLVHGKNPHQMLIGGVDISKRRMNMYGHADLLWGEYNDSRAYSGLARLGMNILPEERANIEAQVMFGELKNMQSRIYSLGSSYRLTQDLSLRGMFNYSELDNTRSIVVQLYYLKGFVF